MPEVGWSADVAQATWIGQRLGPFDSGEVTSVVPAGFPAYARVLHPARDSEGRPIRWSEVAARNELELRSSAHFCEVALLPHPTDGTQMRDVVGPEEGTLTAADATALIAVLRQHATSPDRCWFCLWDGYGWDTTTSSSMSFLSRDDDPPAGAQPGVNGGTDVVDRAAPPVGAPQNPVPREVRDGPRVELPNRAYFLYQGGIELALAFVESERQTPNLWWPEDRAWCVASELDLAWTYIGGSEQLIDDIVGSGSLEAWRVDPTEKHHLRVPPWLTTAIDEAVSQLLAGHPGRVQTSLGTVTATARRPGRLRHGDLWTTAVRPGGSSEGSSWTSLSECNDQALGGEIGHQLTWAVIDLLT